MLISNLILYVFCLAFSLILAIVFYFCSTGSRLWKIFTNRVKFLGISGLIVAEFMWVSLTYILPNIWIVSDRGDNHYYIVSNYKGLGGLGNKFVENASDRVVFVEKVFYSTHYTAKAENKNETFLVQPGDALQIYGKPEFSRPTLMIHQRSYGSSPKDSKYQWFVYPSSL